ncbi:MAG: periplasmic heavy metal sensor [Thermoanaerobaculia bacterium]
MRRWWVVIALLLSLGVNLGLVAAVATRRIAARHGQDPEGPPPPRPDGPSPEGPGPQDLGDEPLPRFRRMADHLGLEGQQRQRFLELQRQLFEETLRVRMRQAETQREVRRELVSREPDRERINTLLQQSARDFLTLEQALAKNIVATRSILSPDQEEEYLRFIARMRPPGMGGFGPQQQQQPPRRRLPPMRGGRFPRERREFPEDGPPPEGEGPPEVF